MILGFYRIIFVCNFISNTAVRHVKYFGICHVLSPSMFRVGCILHLLEYIVLFGFMYGDKVNFSTGNAFCTWDVQIMITVLFKCFVTWYIV